MKNGQFCFITDEYYTHFPDDKLMKNKEVIQGISHDRPCFFSFCDNDNPAILWLVPVSSKYEKYKTIYDKKVEKYGKCNTLYFGQFLGKQAVFLIQNICPVTDKYIKQVYFDKNNIPIQIDNRIATNVIRNAKEVLAKVNRGAMIVFPNIKFIHKNLLLQLQEQQLKNNPQTLPTISKKHKIEPNR